MPLSKEAIQHIEAQAVIAAAKPINIDGGATVTVLPEGITLHKMEPFQPIRDRFRGALKTHALRDFARYVENHVGGETPGGFID